MIRPTLRRNLRSKRGNAQQVFGRRVLRCHRLSRAPTTLTAASPVCRSATPSSEMFVWPIPHSRRVTLETQAHLATKPFLPLDLPNPVPSHCRGDGETQCSVCSAGRVTRHEFWKFQLKERAQRRLWQPSLSTAEGCGPRAPQTGWLSKLHAAPEDSHTGHINSWEGNSSTQQD